MNQIYIPICETKRLLAPKIGPFAIVNKDAIELIIINIIHLHLSCIGITQKIILGIRKVP